MRISDWSSDGCSSDLNEDRLAMPRKSLSAPLALVALVMTPAAVQAAEGADAAGASAPAPALAYPDTVRGDTVDPQFGVDVADPYRSEERRVGKECVRTCNSRRSADK